MNRNVCPPEGFVSPRRPFYPQSWQPVWSSYEEGAVGKQLSVASVVKLLGSNLVEAP